MSKFFHAMTQDTECIFRVEDVTLVEAVTVPDSDGAPTPGVRIGFSDGIPITTGTYDIYSFVATVLKDEELLGAMTSE